MDIRLCVAVIVSCFLLSTRLTGGTPNDAHVSDQTLDLTSSNVVTVSQLNRKLAQYDVKLAQITAKYDAQIAELTAKYETSNNVIGFSARPSTSRDYGSVGQVIIYDSIIVNQGGAFVDSQFICPTTGLYLFSLSVLGEADRDFEAAIFKADNSLGQTTANQQDGRNSGDGLTVVAECGAGQIVRVQTTYVGGQPTRVTAGFNNVFSGALLQIIPTRD